MLLCERSLAVAVVNTMDRWSEEYAAGIKKYLVEKEYPKSVAKDDKRNLRKRAQNFQVVEGKLHYKCRSGEMRLAIFTKEDKERIFQV